MNNFLLALLCLFSVNALATDSNAKPDSIYKQSNIQQISIVSPHWPDYTNPDGSGLYWDVLRNIYEPENITLKHATAPWNRALKMVVQYHYSNAIIGEYLDTSNDLIFPKYPIDTEYMFALSKTGSAIQFHGTESLAGKTVGWIKGYDLIDSSKRNFTLREFRSIEAGIKLLMAGKIDMLIDEEDEIHKALASKSLSPTDFSINQLPDGKDVYVAFKSGPLSEMLINIYNKRSESLLKSGEMKSIYERWDLSPMPAALKLD